MPVVIRIERKFISVSDGLPNCKKIITHFSRLFDHMRDDHIVEITFPARKVGAQSQIGIINVDSSQNHNHSVIQSSVESSDSEGNYCGYCDRCPDKA